MTYAEQLRSDYAAIRARLFAPSKIRDTAPNPICHDIRVNPKDDREPSRAEKATHDNLLDIEWIHIRNEVALKHRIPVKALMSKRVNRALGKARNELYYRMRTETGMTYPQIGRLLGRDHSTVTNGAAKWKRVNGL